MANPAPLRDALRTMPVAPLALLPTPLHEVPRFAEALGGPRIFLKRDDMTGLAMGGNKARKLDYALGRAVQENADVLIGGGGVTQSNHARQCAAAARSLGMEPVLVLKYGTERQRRMQGNLLLDYLLGAEVHFVHDADVREDTGSGFGLAHVMESIADGLRRRGHRPFVLPTSAVPEAAVGYAAGAVELHDQLDERGWRVTRLYITSTGSSLAGLLLGSRILEREGSSGAAGFGLVGVANDDFTGTQAEGVARLFNEAAELLDQPDRISAHDVSLVPGGGMGYGILSKEAREATLLLARTEGVLVDPVYTAKGLAAMIGDIRSGALTRDDAVVFVHTGGHPAIFAYAEELAVGFDYFSASSPEEL